MGRRAVPSFVQHFATGQPSMSVACIAARTTVSLFRRCAHTSGNLSHDVGVDVVIVARPP